MVEIDGLTLNAGPNRIGPINLFIGTGQKFVIAGPSGAGKTTILEGILGFKTLNKGRILVDGVDVSFIPIEKRGFSFLPSEFLLFPNLSVEENIVYGSGGMTKGEIKYRLDLISEALGISHLLGRSNVMTLSAGESQRIAIARALFPRSKLVILDEPLSSLDLPTKERIILGIDKIHKELGLTILTVLHQPEDIIYFADAVGIVKSGTLFQIGPPRKILEEPADEEIAMLLNAGTVIRGEICYHNGVVSLIVGQARINIPQRNSLNHGKQVSVLIPPDAVRLSPEGALPVQLITVYERKPLQEALVVIDGDGSIIRVPVEPSVRLSDRVGLDVDGSKLFIFDSTNSRKGRVVAVCLSEKSGTVKIPHEAIELIEDYGVQGDAHAGTKRQVSLLSLRSIELARSWGLNVGPGSFAENITFDGIEPERLFQGAVLRVGKALIKITQIGKSCHTDCEIRRISGKCVMPTQGLFGEVIRGGTVRAGDELEIVGCVDVDAEDVIRQGDLQNLSNLQTFEKSPN